MKIPNKSCSNIQMYIDNEKFQNPIDNNIDAFINFKNRSPYTNEFLLNYSRFLNNYLIYSFPLERADEDNDDVIESYSLYYIFSVFPSFVYYYVRKND